jgi:hypothetical protein
MGNACQNPDQDQKANEEIFQNRQNEILSQSSQLDVRKTFPHSVPLAQNLKSDQRGESNMFLSMRDIRRNGQEDLDINQGQAKAPQRLLSEEAFSDEWKAPNEKVEVFNEHRLSGKQANNFYSDILKDQKVQNPPQTQAGDEKKKSSHIFLDNPQISSLKEINNFNELLSTDYQGLNKPKSSMFDNDFSRLEVSEVVKKNTFQKADQVRKPASFEAIVLDALEQKNSLKMPSTRHVQARNDKFNDRKYRKSSLDSNYEIIEFQNGDIYEGEIVNLQPEGYGWLKTREFKYTGYFKDNNFEGRGHIKYENGEEFDGYFANGLKEGPGCLKNITGRIIHKGNWHEGVYNDEF